MTKAELRFLERVYECEINFTRYPNSRSKLADKLVEDGMLARVPETRRDRLGSYTIEWLDLTQLGRMTYCMTCGDDDEAKAKGGE